MNYVRQMNAFSDHATADQRFSAYHITLYMALFQTCNKLRMQQTFAITRSHIMSVAKIGSKNTYYKCIKFLHNEGYIHYQPPASKNTHALITIAPFKQPFPHHPQPRPVPEMYPPQPKKDTAPGLELNQPSLPSGTPPVPGVVPVYKQTKQEKQKENTHTPFTPPSIAEVKKHFEAIGKSDLEAQKFFHHYTANGWLQGGKTKIVVWQSAVETWLLRNWPGTPKPSNAPIIPPGKNYNEAL